MKPWEIIDLDEEIKPIVDAEVAHRYQMQYESEIKAMENRMNIKDENEIIAETVTSHHNVPDTFHAGHEFDDLDMVRCEIQDAISNGDFHRAEQLASLIDITIQ